MSISRFVKSWSEVMEDAKFALHAPTPSPYNTKSRRCIFTRTVKGLNGRPVQVPCGKCLYCREHQASSWYSRQICESTLSTGTFFITLTYNQANVEDINVEALQLYFKRLRKAGHQFRYIALAEYGPRTGRPHYHILFFYRSNHGYADPKVMADFHKRHWSFGFVNCKSVTANHHKYIANYGKSLFMRTRSFKLYSLKPGIGKETPLYEYLFNQYLETGERYIATDVGKLQVPDCCIRSYNKALRSSPNYIDPGDPSDLQYSEELHANYLYNLMLAYERFLKRKL